MARLALILMIVMCSGCRQVDHGDPAPAPSEDTWLNKLILPRVDEINNWASGSPN